MNKRFLKIILLILYLSSILTFTVFLRPNTVILSDTNTGDKRTYEKHEYYSIWHKPRKETGAFDYVTKTEYVDKNYTDYRFMFELVSTNTVIALLLYIIIENKSLKKS